MNLRNNSRKKSDTSSYEQSQDPEKQFVKNISGENLDSTNNKSVQNDDKNSQKSENSTPDSREFPSEKSSKKPDSATNISRKPPEEPKTPETQKNPFAKSSSVTRKDIITLPHPHLREKSAKIRQIDAATLQTVRDMMSAAIDWENSRPHEVAVALAAPQIDRLQRIIIIRENFDDKTNRNFTVLINPEIIKYEGEITREQEGCLSVKDVYGLVPRHSKVRIRALDIGGREIHFKSPSPFLARVLQHEIDHCNGICFVDHIAEEENVWSILDERGDLVPIGYEKIRGMGILLER